VLKQRLWLQAGRVAIYGWQRAGGTPIQPLSNVDGAGYADYSHHKGRVDIRRVHLRKVPLAGGIDPDRIAALTPGFAGAHLANLATRPRCWPCGAAIGPPAKPHPVRSSADAAARRGPC
jgi:hypothetical protein